MKNKMPKKRMYTKKELETKIVISKVFFDAMCGVVDAAGDTLTSNVTSDLRNLLNDESWDDMFRDLENAIQDHNSLPVDVTVTEPYPARTNPGDATSSLAQSARARRK
jgi:hypothetical protein